MELGLFAWCAKVLKKNIRRAPSFKLILSSLVIVLLVFAFAGVEPVSSYKDWVVTSVGDLVKVEPGSVEDEQGVQTQKPKEEAEGLSEAEVLALEHEVFHLINDQRSSEGPRSGGLERGVTSAGEGAE